MEQVNTNEPASAKLKDSWSNLQEDYELRNVRKFQDVESGSLIVGTTEILTSMNSKSNLKTEDGPPRLYVPTKTRNLLFNIGVVIAVLDLGVMPIVYFYALSFGTTLKRQTIFIVVTCLFCLMTFAHYTHRCLRLIFKSSERYGPIGWRRRYRLLEFTNVHFALCATIFETVICIGTFPEEPLIRVAALPPAIICYYLGILFLSTSIFTHFQTPLPFAMSSTPKGTPFRPALLAILEDSAAIEYRGESEGRVKMLRRYESSVMFREMVQSLSWAWGGSFLGIAVLSTVFCFGIGNEVIAFGVGWGVPFVLSAGGVLPTVWWVKRCLAEERRTWRGIGAGT